MVSIGSSIRDVSPTSTSNSYRYLPSDFHRLTNRTDPSPQFTPDSALEPAAAEYPNDGRTVVTADKRASNPGLVSDSLRMAQGSRKGNAIRKGSASSVKEEEAGKLGSPSP